jgi:ribonuclease P protein component
MLKKNLRLKKNTAFSATFKLKNCKSNNILTIYLGKQKNNDNIPTKAGFIVSKKIHKRAVKRNKIKRRLREIFSKCLKNHSFPIIEQSLSIIFIANSKSLDADFKTLEQATLNLLQSF